MNIYGRSGQNPIKPGTISQKLLSKTKRMSISEEVYEGCMIHEWNETAKRTIKFISKGQ